MSAPNSVGLAARQRCRNRLRSLLVLAAVLLLWYFLGPDGWTARLHGATREADRLRIRTGGTCHRRSENERTLFESTDAAEVRALVSQIRVWRAISWMSCMCCGGPTLEIYAGDKLLAAVTLQHGDALRWEGVWSCDASLTSASRRNLSRWFAERAIPFDDYETPVADGNAAGPPEGS